MTRRPHALDRVWQRPGAEAWSPPEKVGEARRVAEAEGLRERLPRRLRHRRLALSLAHDDHHRHLGGVQLYMRVEQQQLHDAGVSFVNLWPTEEAGRIGLSADGRTLGRYSVDELATTLGSLSDIGLTLVGVDVHHLKGWAIDVVGRLVAAANPPQTRFFIHDYYALCSNPNLTFGDSCFCGAPPPDSQVCRLCRHGAARLPHLTSMAQLLDELVTRTRVQLIAPAQTAADLFVRHHPQHAARVRIVPHQALVPTNIVGRIKRYRPRLGFVGFGAPIKGTTAWLRLLDTPAIRERFQLYHFGLCAVGCTAEHVDVDYGRQGADAMTRTLTHHGLDFAFLWSTWPETFSFTLYESLAAGAYILTNRHSGNIAAQVQRTGRGRVFRDDGELHRFLLDHAAVEQARRALAELPAYASEWNETLTNELIA